MIKYIKTFEEYSYTDLNTKKEFKEISKIVKMLIKKFDKEYDIPFDMINQGDCNIFAEEIEDLSKEINIVGEVLSDGLFYDPYDETPTEMLLNVSDYGNKPDDFDEIGLPSHYWFYYKGKHFDSDAPNGVDDMFDLPIIKRFYLKYREK
jgi:hypothetical protein